MSKKDVKKLVSKCNELMEAVLLLTEQAQRQGQTISNRHFSSDGEDSEDLVASELAELEFRSKKAQEEKDEEQLAVITLRQKVNRLENQLLANEKKIKELKREFVKSQNKVMRDIQKQIRSFEEEQRKVLNAQNKMIAGNKRKVKRLTEIFIKTCRFYFCDVQVDSLRDVETILRRAKKLNRVDENLFALAKGGKHHE